MYKIVLIRHGESEWNKANLFTGWTDVDLSPQGVIEAKEAGKRLKEAGFTFDEAFTSVLKRGIRTLWLALEDQKLAPVLETEGIIFPRRRGFYRLEVAAKSDGEKEEDFLIAVDMSEEEKKDDLELSPDPLLWDGKEGYIRRRIRYIGNDYLSI
ncbi:MAG: 2,3-bisphosphoglycerate-dependent phosphoglycerate mutase, partial [Candidatus Cloacimonetes bacterium]|nr:2,3-bisphosphoglycerate-dependent phosphoglycerate mutase [Candidatus Cloacimonadota bacterium]MCK9242251.1 2,3-bisphosphoglycerate-dependent phosphoglycerate mutase [Candidatus Cloacimonadota bacterium]